MSNDDEQYTVITSGKGGQTTEPDDLSLEEQRRLAGLDEETQDLIEPEYRIDHEAVPLKRDVSKSPLSRSALVLGLLGFLVFFGAALLFLFGLGRSRQPDLLETSPTPADEIYTPNEADTYKSRLALVDQQAEGEEEPEQRIVTTAPRTTPSPTPQASPTPASRPAPAYRSTRSAPPPARPAPARPAPVRPVRSSNPTPVEQIDPFERWSQLAEIGSQGAEVELTEAELAEAQANDTDTQTWENNEAAIASAAVPREPTQDIPAEVIGDESLVQESEPETMQVSNQSSDTLIASTQGVPNFLSPGARGILEHQPVSNEPTQTPIRYQVAIGSSAEAEVTVPLIWEPGGDNEEMGKFAVTLKDPLYSVDGEVALPAGTIFITEARSVASRSRLVQQVVIAVVYRASDGEIRQEPIEPGTILIRGEDNEPLIAETAGGENSFRNDFLYGLSGALGRVGELINQPEVVSSSSSSSGDDDSSSSSVITRTQRGDDIDVAAAALDGFFGNFSDRMENRFERNQDRREPVLMVEEGKDVSVFVNGILEVQP